MEQTPQDFTALAVATLFRGAVVAFLALWFARLADLERDLERRVKVLEGLLAICSFCKRIQNETGEWEQFEAFIEASLRAVSGEANYPGMLNESA